jgi:hypothetical protein
LAHPCECRVHATRSLTSLALNANKKLLPAAGTLGSGAVYSLAVLAIPLRALRLRAFKAFDRKGRKEISAKFAKNFAKNNEHGETPPLLRMRKT